MSFVRGIGLLEEIILESCLKNSRQSLHNPLEFSFIFCIVFDQMQYANIFWNILNELCCILWVDAVLKKQRLTVNRYVSISKYMRNILNEHSLQDIYKSYFVVFIFSRIDIDDQAIPSSMSYSAS